MDLFEYILVITSVIYALAIAQILSGIGRLAQTEATIRLFLPHTLWVVILFVCILICAAHPFFLLFSKEPQEGILFA